MVVSGFVGMGRWGCLGRGSTGGLGGSFKGVELVRDGCPGPGQGRGREPVCRGNIWEREHGTERARDNLLTYSDEADGKNVSRGK